MSTVNPVTAGYEITRAQTPKNVEENPPEEDTSIFGGFSQDIVEISKLGKTQQQQANQQEANREIERIANEAVSVSSTIGRNRSQGNLTNSQAIALYNKISRLL